MVVIFTNNMSTKFIHKGDEKKKYVKQMFNDISIHYDRLNFLSSFGIDRYWRNMLVKEIPLSSHDVLLDVATGTGDVALAFYVKYKVNVVGVDIADKMIDIANQKARKYKTSSLNFSIEDAESMSFDDNKFSALTISFGFRNMGFYDKALSEFYRVLQNKGKIAILEFSNPKSRWFSPIFKFYFKNIVPLLGSLFTRKDAYMYLPESVDYFLTREEVCSKMNSAGFSNIVFKDMTFGVATIYTGVKDE